MMFFCPGYPINPPLEHFFYTHSSKGQVTWHDHKLNPHKDSPRNWVLIDNDFNKLINFDFNTFRTVLEELIVSKEIASGLTLERFNVVGLHGFSRTELLELYKGRV